MKIGNTTLIPQNVALTNATKVVICDDSGNVVCRCELGKLSIPTNIGIKKYSVGLLSDSHTTNYAQYHPEDTQEDLKRAISYLSTNVEITCVCGDLSQFNDDGGLEKHKEIVDANKGNMEVLEIAGNHEHYALGSDFQGHVVPITDTEIMQYTGYPLHYVVERNGDVFIMCGAVDWYNVFDETSIQWLHTQLETYRNRRCFLFVHAPLEGTQYCGDSTNVLTWDMLVSYKQQLINLLSHYKNVIYFHGHTHGRTQNQDYTQRLIPPRPANYDNALGVHSVHIPSLSIPRDISSGERVDKVNESQGYLMDVYENHIILRGVDFVKSEFIPIAHYCLDTTLKTVKSKPASYFDIN